MKLVRRILQAQEASYESEKSVVGNHSQNKRKRRKHQHPGERTVDEHDAVQSTVQSMLFLDQKIASTSAKKDTALERINEEIQKAKKRRKKNDSAIVGNSRSSSSQMRLPSERTFNKKRHKKEVEEKRLMEIAKLLKQSTSTKRNKGSAKKETR
jgi:hypothetical protein